ncbi:hypothetical protein [Streptomyces sp. FH025]|uniref:hypothetical protein n=1 Tax=Streptomyces sp. FH025 TaxID=2815937 RepID=UPI001FAE7E49|nr:hypothetical protein [Streptomyces sp. FH025]
MTGLLLERARSRERRISYSELSQLLADEGHNVPAHSAEMDLLLADVSRQESPNGIRAMLSAMVVFKDPNKQEPGAGFYRLAREEFGRTGDNLSIWIKELEYLERDYGQR